MAVYVFSTAEVLDEDAYHEYKKQLPATLEKYGGKLVAGESRVEQLEGKWLPSNVNIIEFDSADQARIWHDSPEYMAIADSRVGNYMVLIIGHNPAF